MQLPISVQSNRGTV